jgi:sporulation protein YlmC with PRC-barrel domain
VHEFTHKEKYNMIRKLLATTALATLVASGAYAQDTTTPAPATPPAAESAAPQAPTTVAEGELATNIVGESVYNGTGDDAESIGKVSDIVFDRDGQATKLVIGVGGFLGVGTKNVAFDYDKLKWTEKDGDRWLVAETSKDALKALPAFDETPYEPAPTKASSNATVAPGGTAAPGSTAMAPADTKAPDTTATAPADANGAASATGNAAAPADKTAQDGEAEAKASMKPAEGNLATKILGEDVYNGTGDDAEKIGDVSDIVVSKGGKAAQLVIGVGGFLGIGSKDVALDYETADWAEKDGDRWLVVKATKDQLKSLPAFDRKAYGLEPATVSDSKAPATATSSAGTTGTMAPAPTDQSAQVPAADGSSTDASQTTTTDKSTLTEVPADKISADNLIGTTVYGTDDARVGKIGDVVLSKDNGIDAIVIDVGGFLGLGSKPVAIGMEKMKFMADKDGNQYLYTDLTKDQLEAQAAYDKGSYAENRDKQRMIVQ